MYQVLASYAYVPVCQYYTNLVFASLVFTANLRSVNEALKLARAYVIAGVSNNKNRKLHYNTNTYLIVVVFAVGFVHGLRCSFMVHFNALANVWYKKSV